MTLLRSIEGLTVVETERLVMDLKTGARPLPESKCKTITHKVCRQIREYANIPVGQFLVYTNIVVD